MKQIVADVHGPVILLGTAPTTETWPNPIWSLNPHTHVLFTEHSHVTPEGRFTAFQGAGVVSSQLIKTSQELSAWWAPSASVDDVTTRFSNEVRGACAALFADRNEDKITLVADPLGSAILFHVSEGNFALVSADLNSLLKVARRLGMRLSKSADYLAIRTLTGNGGLVASPYEQISVVPFGHFVQVQAERYRFIDSHVLETDLQDTRGYLELAQEAEAEIRMNISAVAQASPAHRIAQLTGGFDSRLVLAGLMKEGRENQFSYFTSGQPGLADRDIADGILRRYGLSRASSSGQTDVVIDDVGERLQASLDASGGLSSEGPTLHERTSNVLILGGVYGENLRTMYPDVSYLWAEGERSPDVLMSAMWGRNVIEPRGLLTEGFRDKIATLFMESLRGIDRLGFPKDTVGDAHYLLYRNRYYSGQMIFRWNSYHARHDPLYSRAALKMARTLPLEPRRLNMAGYDMLHVLAEDLTRLPYDYPRFGADFKRLRRYPEEISLDSAATIPIERIPSERVVVEGKRGSQIAAMPRNEALAVAKKLQAAFWQVHYLPIAQALLEQSLEHANDHRLGSVFNTDYLYKLATARLTNRVDIRRVYLVLGSINWYAQ